MHCARTSSLLFVLAIHLHVTAASPTNHTIESGLKCFQCASDSRDSTPLCDTSFWKLTTRAEKRDMTFQCPTKKARYCVKKVVRGKYFTHTTRGCNGEADSVGTKLREGCTNIRAESDTTVCLCSTDYCNAAVAHSSTLYPIGLLVLVRCWSATFRV